MPYQMVLVHSLVWLVCLVGLGFFQLKEKAANSTELQHQLDKAKQQHQEQQTLQQNTTAKLREAQVTWLCILL